MKTWKKLLFGGFGGLLPTFAVLYVGGLATATKDLLVGAIVGVVAGAMLAWAQDNVRTAMAAVQVGMAVPGLMTSLAAAAEARSKLTK